MEYRELDKLIDGLNPKQKKVLIQRYGLVGKKKTLQQIGDEFGITRERIRQIENHSLNSLKNKITDQFKDLILDAKKHLDSCGGIREDDIFINEIINITKTEASNGIKNKIRFIFIAAGNPLYSRENQELNGFWYNNENSKKNLHAFVEKTIKLFETTDKKKILDEKIFLNKIQKVGDIHLLSLSKKFSMNPFGDVGLKDWPEINPKNIREKAYLAMKKHGKPLHFADIAKQISKTGLSAQLVNIQTVHNELIKDVRFVLVGRGVYALQEYGYEPGTVKEVIERLIKTNGPLNSNEIIKLVNQERFLKENTILLSLQNRKCFQRLENGKYTIQEA